MKRLAAILVLALIPSVALAVGIRSADNITLAKGDIHHGTLYAAGQTLTVDGAVDGDLICAGNTITINGPVHGDVLCAGQTITVNGAVDGNIRVAGQTIALNGQTARNISAAAQSFTLGKDAKTSGDVSLLGQTATVQGPVGRDLAGIITNLTLSAPIAGNLDAQVQDLTLGSAAHIAGSMTYTSDKSFAVSQDQVGGKITRNTPSGSQHHTLSPRDEAWAWIGSRLYWIAATLTILLLFAWVAPRPLRHLSGAMAKRPLVAVGWGAVAMFATPAACFALAFTVIGIPLAILLGLAYIIGIAFSGALVSVVVGRWITQRTDWNHNSLPLAILVGVPTTLIVLGLPIIGGILSLAATLWAWGGVVVAVRTARS